MGDENIAGIFFIIVCFFLLGLFVYIIHDELTTPKPCDKEYIDYCIKEAVKNEQITTKENLTNVIEMCHLRNKMCGKL